MYVFGDEILFSGTNTGSNTTYLFFSGPGLKAAGSQIDSNDPRIAPVTDGDVSTFTAVRVKADNHWSWTWDTHKVPLNAGTYTIYASSAPRDGTHLGSAIYDKVAINITEPTLSVTARPSDAKEGETITISGTATGHPGPGVAIWVIGPEYSNRFMAEPDFRGLYSLDIDSAATHLFQGTYHIFAEHPSTDDTFDLDLNGDYLFNNRIRSNIFTFRGNGRLYGEAAYTAFSAATRGPEINDLIVPVSFSLATPPATTAVTIFTSPSANATYSLGDEITFSGTNTDSRTTYLFITGPGLNPAGLRMQSDHPKTSPVIDDAAATFKMVPDNDDHSWQWKWDTRASDLDYGTYQVYAVSTPHDAGHLAGAKYNLTQISIRKPFVTASGSSSAVGPGDRFFINGTATGRPATGIAVWIFSDRFSNRSVIQPAPDGTFSFEPGATTTGTLPPGNYSVIIQHPMENRMFDVSSLGYEVYNRVSGTGSEIKPLFSFSGPGGTGGANASLALRQALSDPSVDDTYAGLEFSVRDTAAVPAPATILPAQNPTTSASTGNSTIDPSLPAGNRGDALPAGTLVVVSGLVLLCGTGGAVLFFRRKRNGTIPEGSSPDTSLFPMTVSTMIRGEKPGIRQEKTPLPSDKTTGAGTSPALPNGSFPEELTGKYTGISFIGRGGFAMVYSAFRRVDNRRVAVKIPIGYDERTGQSFLNEIKVWETLHHPNIVEVIAVNILPVPYVEMEFVPGSLETIPKPVQVLMAARIIRDITGAIGFAHEHRFIHRDIKPQNILLTEDLVPKITDWGISKVLEESAKQTTVAGFSLAYAAPEQIAPEKIGSTDERTDIYQIGVVFYELVTGSVPFGGESMMERVNGILYEDPELPSQYNPDAADVDTIILKCLAKDPARRYQSADELLDALREFLDSHDRNNS
jgi:hypothetical protein